MHVIGRESSTCSSLERGELDGSLDFHLPYEPLHASQHSQDCGSNTTNEVRGPSTFSLVCPLQAGLISAFEPVLL